MSERDHFHEDMQLNARRRGVYMDLAADVETKKCVFCDLKEKYVVATNRQGALTVNVFPYTDGQLVVVPSRHMETFGELTLEEAKALHELNQQGVMLLNRVMGIDNIWLILRDGKVAGKTVKHLHWNIMPYHEGLNTWHYDDITVAPIDLAARLREGLRDVT